MEARHAIRQLLEPKVRGRSGHKGIRNGPSSSQTLRDRVKANAEYRAVYAQLCWELFFGWSRKTSFQGNRKISGNRGFRAMKSGASGGGAAAAGGMDFQHRVAAWVAAYILAEKDVSPPWDLPAGTTLEWLRCETEQPVDDLLVGTSASGLVFGQIKRTLHLSESPDSDLASALDQFVRQFMACRNSKGGSRPWDRPLDLQKDRLVLVTSPSSSQPVRVHLRNVLSRLNNLPQSQPLENAAANDNERRALAIAQEHLVQSWQKLTGSPPSEPDLRKLLSLIRIHVLDLEAGGTDEGHVKDILRQAVLKNPDGADAAWQRS
jgi:hypothetical protein